MDKYSVADLGKKRLHLAFMSLDPTRVYLAKQALFASLELVFREAGYQEES